MQYAPTGAQTNISTMNKKPEIHQRRSLRLKEYDYTQPGAYFITIVTQNRAQLFGEIVDGEMLLNAAGRVVQSLWDEIPTHFPNSDMGAFVVMPNHVHGVIILSESEFVGAGLCACPWTKPGQPRGGLPSPNAHALGIRLTRSEALQSIRWVRGVCRNPCDPKDVPTLDTTLQKLLKNRLNSRP